jgi:hypothetical protein
MPQLSGNEPILGLNIDPMIHICSIANMMVVTLPCDLQRRFTLGFRNFGSLASFTTNTQKLSKQ